MEGLHREAVYLWYYFDIQLRQILPYWVLGIVLGSLVSVFAKDHIHGLFRSIGNKKLGIIGIPIASILGIASPLCMYGTIPIAASFSKSGVKDDWLAAFMMSSILLNPQLIVYSTALGSVALVIRIISSFVCGIAAGLLVRWFYHDKSFFNFVGFNEPKSHDTDPNLLLRFMKNIGRNIKATGLWFLLGIILSAVFQRYVPADVISGLFGENEGFGGSIKKISIGIASSKGKEHIHSGGTGEDMWSAAQDAFLESMAEAGKSIADYLNRNILFELLYSLVYIGVWNKKRERTKLPSRFFLHMMASITKVDALKHYTAMIRKNFLFCKIIQYP